MTTISRTLFFLSLAPVLCGAAQLHGTILDPQNAAIPGAQVSLVSRDNTLRLAVSTDGAGAYLFFVSECMCVKERCQDACATNFCSPDLKDPDAACNACLSVKNSECAGEVSSKCTASGINMK